MRVWQRAALRCAPWICTRTIRKRRSRSSDDCTRSSRRRGSKDFERLDSYHFYGPKFTRFSGGSPVIMDAAATRKAEHEGLAALQELTMGVDALKIDVFGTVGIATFILNYSFASGDATVRRKERSTLVFVNERGDWKIAHEHLSPITPAEPDGPENKSQPMRSENGSRR
ncbi:MAG: nuclear transport factor 2 family protein [Verrucomicrobia bacterium]|nr:nuclear transport factor 2 family protein [Verrucomicrobiota bacterium]